MPSNERMTSYFRRIYNRICASMTWLSKQVVRNIPFDVAYHNMISLARESAKKEIARSLAGDQGPQTIIGQSQKFIYFHRKKKIHLSKVRIM